MKNLESVKKLLHEIGLNENESQVYLSLLKIGAAPASTIASSAKLSRSTVKYICDRLHKRNIIQGIDKGNTSVYSIESPEKLLYFVERKQESLEMTKGKLNQFMGFLKNMQNPYAVIPKVQFFDGLEGIGRAFTHVTEKSTKGDTNITFAKFFPAYEEYAELFTIIQGYIKRRVKKGVRSRVIACESKEARGMKAMDELCLRETRITKDMLFDFPGGIIVGYADCICFLCIEEGGMFGVTIESTNIFQMWSGFFEIAWKSAQD